MEASARIAEAHASVARCARIACCARIGARDRVLAGREAGEGEREKKGA
jgi:hypothetical protein